MKECLSQGKGYPRTQQGSIPICSLLVCHQSSAGHLLDQVSTIGTIGQWVSDFFLFFFLNIYLFGFTGS